MRKLRRAPMLASIGVALSLLIAACAPRPAVEPSTSPWQARGFVAHALGSPADGPLYTNSREAFDASYAKGFRTFETDLVLLKDGHIVLAHDGREANYGLPKPTTFGELTSEAMRGRNFDGTYPVMFDADLIELMREHRDVVVLLDAKGDPETTQVAIAARMAKLAPPDIRARMVPHVHSEEQLGALRELHAFPSFILALYLWRERDVSEAPAFMRSQRLDTIILRPQDYSDRLRRELERSGTRWIFITSFTTRDEIEPWRAKNLGVYSNDWIGPVS